MRGRRRGHLPEVALAEDGGQIEVCGDGKQTRSFTYRAAREAGQGFFQIALPSEFPNVIRWLVAHGYVDEQIEKVVGGNVLLALPQVWGLAGEQGSLAWPRSPRPVCAREIRGRLA
jgi:hypothetical protein